ncbi:hypothetical protein ABPG75_012158 [Micractinium tetrahymenae]
MLSASVALVGLALAVLSATASAADLLVLTRDWTPTTCSDANYNCAPTYPNSFRVGRLALASDASPQLQTGCKGGGGLKSSDLDKSGISREELDCAWQNATEGLKSLQNSWKVSWADYGKCTPAQSAVQYLQLGLELDQQYPLPNDLPASLEYLQLLDALGQGFGAEAYVTCTGSMQLASISLCFNASLEGGGPSLTDCPWNAPADCLGALAVPSNTQGESTCASYYKQSPVSLNGLAAAPGLAPSQQPAAAPAPTPSSTPAQAPAAGPPAALPGTAPSPAQAASTPPPAASPPSTVGQAGGIAASPPPEAPAPASGDSPLSASTTAGSAVPGPSSSSEGASGPSTGAKIGVLCAGIAGGVAVGAAALGAGWWVYQRKRRRSQAVGSSASSAAPDPEKGVMSSSAESLSSWSSSDGVPKRMDSRSSGTSAVAAAAAAAAAGGAARGAGSHVHRSSSGSASPRSGAPRRPESVRSAGSRRSEGASSVRRTDSGGAALVPRLDSGSGSSLRHAYNQGPSGSAKVLQPAGPGWLHAGGSPWGASPPRSLARSGGSGGSGSGWGADPEAPPSPGSPHGLRRSVSNAGAAAGGSGSLHRSLSGPPRSPGKAPAGWFVPGTPPKALRFVQPAPPPRSPSSKQGNTATHLPSVNE